KFRYVAAKLPRIRHATMVLGLRSIDAHVYDPVGGLVRPVDCVTVLSIPRRRLVPTSARHRVAPDTAGSWATEEAAGELRTVESELPAGSAGARVPAEGAVEPRYDRQVMLFGPEGQRALGELTVGLAGLGSVGMLFAQQLVYLGVRHFVLVDPDVVET